MRQSLAYDEDVGEFSPPSATNENLTCDFLVAGGGLSGLSAADAAIRRGLNVVVVEKGVYGKEAASGLSAGQFLTGWAKPVDVMIAELAQQASPEDDEVSAIRARVYEARAASERSLMARGVFLSASRERSKR